MLSRYNQLKAINKWIEEKEHQYDLALDEFTFAISHINKGIIHGKKEQGLISSINSYISRLTRADFELQLALNKKSRLLKGWK